MGARQVSRIEGYGGAMPTAVEMAGAGDRRGLGLER